MMLSQMQFNIFKIACLFFYQVIKMYIETYHYQEQQRNDITYLVSVAQDNIQL